MPSSARRSLIAPVMALTAGAGLGCQAYVVDLVAVMMGAIQTTKGGTITDRLYLSVYYSINCTFRPRQRTEILLCHHLSVPYQTSTFSEFDR